MTPSLSLDEIEAKARAATPGPWREHSYAAEVCSDDVDAIATCNIDGNRLTGGTAQQHGDAAYIAAASPDVVIALCARVRELEEQVRKHIKLCEAAGRVLARWAPTDSIDKEVWNYCNDALGNGTKEALAVLSPNSIILRALLAKGRTDG